MSYFQLSSNSNMPSGPRSSSMARKPSGSTLMSVPASSVEGPATSNENVIISTPCSTKRRLVVPMQPLSGVLHLPPVPPHIPHPALPSLKCPSSLPHILPLPSSQHLNVPTLLPRRAEATLLRSLPLRKTKDLRLPTPSPSPPLLLRRPVPPLFL